MNDERFDELLKDMREEGAPEEQVAGARQRVWARLKGASSAACAEFRPEFADYLAGRLTPSRRLLIDDHLGRCAECRCELAGARGERKVVPMPQVDSTPAPGWVRWAAIAAVLLAALYLGRDRIDSALAPSGARATVVSVSGEVYKLHGEALNPGSALEEGEVVRTAAGSRAVIELTDGSLVEVNQRSEFALRGAWSGMTIRLDRGDVVVQAAEQRRGRLRVVTRDSEASVKGTIFAVSSGTAGSVVSVVSGSVAVAQPGANVLLTAGQQAASNRALQRVSVEQAISWSEDAEKYYSILADLTAIEKELAAMPGPALRHQSELLGYLPASAVVYFAIPNLDGTIRQALYLVDRRAEDNAALNEWWSSEGGQGLREKLDRLQAITPLLGDEVVCILSTHPDNPRRELPVVLARVQDGREEELRAGIERIADNSPESIAYQIGGGILFVSDSQEDLTTVTAQLGSGASSPFASEILRRYQEGVSWIAAVDVNAFSQAVPEQEARLLGLTSMRYVFFEQGAGGGRELTEATLSFAGARTGIASWLAPPGSSGSAEYVSDRAIAVLSGSTRDPRQAFDELIALAGPESVPAREVRELESQVGISVAEDIAASLGTDFTFSLEQVSLPAPGWLAVVEVRNPGVLDEAVRRLVEARNNDLESGQEDQRITMTQETVNGRTWNRMSMPGAPGALNWTYDRGYLVASMDRAVATRAIAVRDAGASLVHSVLFQERYPVTMNLHSSGFFWLNANGVLSDLAEVVDSQALRNLAGSREPVLIVVNGEMERIHAGSRTRLTSLVLDLMLIHGPEGHHEHREESEPAASL